VIIRANSFAGQLPFVLPNQQCQHRSEEITEAKCTLSILDKSFFYSPFLEPKKYKKNPHKNVYLNFYQLPCHQKILKLSLGISTNNPGV